MFQACRLPSVVGHAHGSIVGSSRVPPANGREVIGTGFLLRAPQATSCSGRAPEAGSVVQGSCPGASSGIVWPVTQSDANVGNGRPNPTQLLVQAAAHLRPAPDAQAWNYGWSQDEYRHNGHPAVQSAAGIMIMTPEGVVIYEQAVKTLM